MELVKGTLKIEFMTEDKVTQAFDELLLLLKDVEILFYSAAQITCQTGDKIITLEDAHHVA